jgi:hypothetical protein
MSEQAIPPRSVLKHRNIMQDIFASSTGWLVLGVILALIKPTVALSPSGVNVCSREER